jgi:hydroxyethylthiazole kinase-like uncharacterized protein yjeF
MDSVDTTPRPESARGPRRVDPLAGPWPLHDVQASRACERAALAHSAPHALMEAAGVGAARLALALAPAGRSVQVLAGPGNNGGDGLVAARHLLAAGWRVQVLHIGDPARTPADAAQALVRAQQAGVPIAAWSPQAAAAPCDVIVDALLGLGTRRAPEGRLREAILAAGAAAAAGVPVLAVDIPSGLHADTGQPLGDAGVHATSTLALLTLKPGCFTGQGRDHAGTVWFDDLGVAPSPPSLWLGGPPRRAARSHAAHKGALGDVVVVGGAGGMVGAAWLAARAALAAGAGRVYASLLDEAAPGLDPARIELMSRPHWWTEVPSVLAGATTVCGCGGGGGVGEALPALLAHAARLVLDADALNLVAADRALGRLLAARRLRGQPTVLTPHPLEAARLLRSDTRAVQGDRIAAARRLAADFECCVVLKGSGSVVAAHGGTTSINPTGNAALATPGSGDVLAGWIGGLWAQQPRADASAIASAAVWEHGRAADTFVEQGAAGPLRAGDLVEAMARRPGRDGAGAAQRPGGPAA